jgi:hypothetical protein
LRDVAEILVPWELMTLALFAFLDWDESRLTVEERGRAWPAVTRTLAVVYLGVLSLPVHFWRTRGFRGSPSRIRRRWAVRVVAGLLAVGLPYAVGLAIDALPESAVLPVTVLVSIAFVAGLLWLRRGRREQCSRIAAQLNRP